MGYKCKTMICLVYGETCLKADVARFRNSVYNRNCQWCIEPVEENGVHMLFECERLRNVRAEKWGNVLECMPAEMQAVTVEMSSRDKMLFIFSGYNGAIFEDEYLPLCDATIEFCHCMYDERQKYEE